MSNRPTVERRANALGNVIFDIYAERKDRTQLQTQQRTHTDELVTSRSVQSFLPDG